MIWRRLKNLWLMSDWEMITEGKPQPLGTYKPFFVKKMQQAKIIDMTPITSDIPTQYDYSA